MKLCSINVLHDRGFAPFDGSAAVVPIAEQLVRKGAVAVVAVSGTGLRYAGRFGCLLAGFARTGILDRLACPLRGGDLLRPRRSGLRRTQVEIGRDRQRRTGLDGELIRRSSLDAQVALKARAT